ncbi:DUF58 domain-containing protein [Chondromyces apiculatus]|uniref:Putative membrane protein n=1 Tax=Chondromyces apiculatus DSM 436 TaxID=1192034 RepID=A0A017T5Y8_9BACT|nr:DUF58 domain-containing protein [Chondromyces apiculatus]EYF04614.1 putative membrane protein [Chondromyces apiculatus DSM 436]
MSPSRRGLLIAAGGLPLALLPALVSTSLWPAWVVFWALLLLLFGLDAALLLRGGTLTADLDTPDTLHVGATHTAHLRLVVPHLRRHLTARVGLDASEHLAPDTPRPVPLGPDAPPVAIPLRPLRRGPATLDAAWVRYEGPLGLVLRSARVPLGRAVRVVANVPAVRADALRFFGPREATSGLKIERFVGDGTELHALRDFLPGHDRRAIDWKASARHTRLLVREHRAERSHQVILVVDTGRLMAEPLAAPRNSPPSPTPSSAPASTPATITTDPASTAATPATPAVPAVPRLDHAIHAALLLAFISARAGDRIGLYAFDARPGSFLPPRAGAAAFRAVLDQSGQLAYTDAETNFTLGLTNLLSRLTRRSLIVILTDFVDTVTAELMIENVTRVSRRHLCIFVALRDPLFASLAAAPATSMLDVHRAVVADALQQDREVVLKRLARRGVICIDASPEQVGPELVNRYLEVKRREMI